MKQFLYFIRKEFYHLLRDRRTLFILFGMPVMQIVIFGFALTNEVKNAKIMVLDHAKDESSIRLINQISASRYFDVATVIHNSGELVPTFHQGKVRLALVIPPDFEEELYHGNAVTIQVIGDATDPNVATTLSNYASVIIRDFQDNLRGQQDFPYRINTEYRMIYNPQLQGSYSFVPGVMAMVLLLVGAMMTSISIVREKELGTMEVILVSPIVPMRIVIAKMIPYLFLSMINIATILLLSVYVLDVPIRGSLLLLVIECFLFTLTALALGLLISSVADSQQTAMLLSLMGMFLPTVMFSGFMFPVENMPWPLQWISNIVPAKWFYYIVKDVMIKGTGLDTVWKETLILLGMFLILLTASIRNFKIRLE